MDMTKRIVTPGSSVLFSRCKVYQNASPYALAAMNQGDGYAIQIQLPPELPNGAFLVCRNGKNTVFELSVEDDSVDRNVFFAFYTRGESNVFRLSSPIGHGKAAELFIHASDVRTSLYVDGNLADEEWPLGEVACTDPMELAVSPEIHDVTIWNSENLMAPTLQWQGETASQGLQYWRPEGHNTGVGDCMPFWHDSTYHLFFLFDRRRHKSKLGLGAHQWAHASSRDLVHWTHHEMAIPITEQWEGSICTGSVYFHGGNYFAYYSARMSDRSDAMLSVSTSGDGLHFQKNPPLTSLQAPYDGPSARDPVVFADDAGLFHMLVTTSLNGYPVKHHGGCLAHLTSPDLWHWSQLPPFIIPGYTDQPECSDYFFWNGWHYLVFSNNGIARYRMSRSVNGPWTKPVNDMLNCPNVTVPKTAEFAAGRRISVGFLHDDYQYASCTVFREIIQNSDGTLGSSFVPEMIPRSGECAYDVMPLTEGVVVGEGTVSVHSHEGFSAAAITGLPTNKRITLSLDPRGGVFGLCLKSDVDYGCGKELRFDAIRKKVGFKSCNESSIEENSRDSIWDVEGLNHRFTIDIIVKDDLIDVCINNCRTLITKCKDADTSVVCLFASCGGASFEDIRVMPLGSN